MTFYVETETQDSLPFDLEELFQKVAEKALDFENCPYEAEINLILTDNASIQEINKENREIDAPTDVLSFPMLDYDTPSDFSKVEDDFSDCFNPETGELILGDIIISAEKAREQAEAFGHSLTREIAFLIAHSMLHLFGYDHMLPEEAAVMESKQKQILEELGINR